MDPLIWAALVTQLGGLAAGVLAALFARGAGREAGAAKEAARDAKTAGAADHSDHTDRLGDIARSLNRLKDDVGGIRGDHRQVRRELHDLRTDLTNHLTKDTKP